MEYSVLHTEFYGRDLNAKIPIVGVKFNFDIKHMGVVNAPQASLPAVGQLSTTSSLLCDSLSSIISRRICHRTSIMVCPLEIILQLC
jgi:hypothetical protein